MASQKITLIRLEQRKTFDSVIRIKKETLNDPDFYTMHGHGD